MTTEDLKKLLDKLRALPTETEWVEFKVNDCESQSIGEYISALSNSACLHRKEHGYLVFGIENKNHVIVGTKFKPRKEKVGNEELESWLSRLLTPRIDFKIFEFPYVGMPVVIFKIDPAQNIPVRFKRDAYIRVGSCKRNLADYPEKEKKIWNKAAGDWSARICEGATISSLDEEAVSVAKGKYKAKYKDRPFAKEVESWDTATFLDKAKITINGKITNTALLLLGKPESSHFLSPAVTRITWILEGAEKAYEHFDPPFYLNVNRVYQKIRNIRYKILPENTLMPIEVEKYEQWIILEALNNCIAHQDYSLNSRIIVTERSDELIFANAGNFYEGTIEDYTLGNKTPERYRNNFLAQAMVTLDMIDTVGNGIKKMFFLQRKRYFPLPEYDLSDLSKVILKIYGHIIDENFTKLLIEKSDLDLKTVILLDKVQKHYKITKEASNFLRKMGLVEGRYPNLFISAKVAAITGDKSRDASRHFDNKHYKNMISDFLNKHRFASRHDIDDLLISKLPNILDEEQKRKKINNLLHEMSKKDESIINTGTRKNPKWALL